MKKVILVIACFVALQLQSQTKNISTEQWREDLRSLQKTVHNDYPFLFKKITKRVFDKEVEKTI